MRLSDPTGFCRLPAVGARRRPIGRTETILRPALLSLSALLAPAAHADYALQFSEFNAISTVGAFILGLSQLLFAWNVWRCVRAGEHSEPAAACAWENAAGREWQRPSPPPHHSWLTQPEIK